MKSAECRHRADVAEFIRGELDAAACSVMDAHLSGCAECRAAVEDARRVMARLGADPDVAVSRDQVPLVLDRIAGRPVVMGGLWVRGVAAAAGLALLLGGWVWLRNGAGPAVAAKADPLPAAVAWLCETQEADGSWSTARWGGRPQFEVALTGLSLMALLQEEEKTGAGQAAIDRAVGYLVSQQDDTGRLGPAFDAELYNQGIATLALARAYQARRTEALRKVLDKSLARMESLQNADGGWGYQNTMDKASNMSLTLWQVEALRLAGKAGWVTGRDRAARGLRWMTRMVSRNGSFGYRQPGDVEGNAQTLTAMGAMSLVEGGEGFLLNPEVSRAVREQVARVAEGMEPDMDYYRRYFLAATLKKMGEEPATVRRLTDLRKQLIARQVGDGVHKGSWPADDQWGSAGGRVYATAMASLSLR